MKIILVLISILIYFLWRANSPFPSPLNWDIWEHQTVINAIRNGTVAVFPSHLSDTFQFDGYTTVFHTILAGIQNLLHVQNVLGFWWISEGIFFVLTTLATYLFVHTITKNKPAALAGGILSAGFFESAVAFTTLFLMPQTAAALLWVVAMTVVVTRKTKKQKLLTALIATLLILPVHAIVGALGGLFLCIMAIKPKLHWLVVLAAGYIIPTYLAYRFGLTGLNAGEAQHFDQTLPQKLALLYQWYGILPIPFLAMGLWKGNRTLTLLFAASVGLLASSFPYVLKFMVIIRYIMIAVMALGVKEFLDLQTSKAARHFGIYVITAVVLIIFTTNITAWKKPVVFHGVASHISSDELNAARFLKKQYGNNPHTLLVSDPATQHILEPLTHINTQGGAYMTRESRQALIDAVRSATPTTFMQNLLRIRDKINPDQHPAIIFAVSYRTLTWLAQDAETRLSIAYNVWRPNALSLDDNLIINSWGARFGLREVYRNVSMVVFEAGVSL